MDQQRVFYDGEAQSGAAHLLGTALVHPVEPLEDAVLGVLRDADSGIGHRQKDFRFHRLQVHVHVTAGVVVFNAVFAEVVDDAVKGFRNPVHRTGFSLEGNGHARLFRRNFQAVHRIFGDGEEIRILPLHFRGTAVQLAQADGVFHQLGHPQGFRADFCGERPDVLFLNHAVFQQLRVSGDGVERRLQFVRHVGGEILTNLRRPGNFVSVLPQLLLLLGHTADQRSDFLEIILIHMLNGLIQVQLVDRLHDFPGKPGSQPQGNEDGEYCYKCDGWGDAQKHHPHRFLVDGHPEHALVGQALRGVKLFYGKGVGVANALAETVLLRLFNFRTSFVIAHGIHVRPVVEEHRAVRSDPGNSVVVGI